LLAKNPYSEEFKEGVAFLASSKTPHGLSTDRSEFLGREGGLQRPAALTRIGLSGRVVAGYDPCAAIQIHVDLPAQGSDEVFFLIGWGENEQEALKTVIAYRDPARVEQAWQELNAHWDNLLNGVQISTPDPAMNLLTNRWLLYQTLASRLWGRSAFYQSSGAYGFRDQLQDSMALVHTAPELTRAQLIRAAQHQFKEGDVLHWWHPPSGRGVRTRISDDLVWLPYVLAHYLEATSDESILTEDVAFLEGNALEPYEHERYDHFQTGNATASLYEHACRALNKALTRGPHDLPLIGGGDWNDGMNRVGVQGKGESIWLAWFLISTLKRFMPICIKQNDQESIARYQAEQERLRQAVEEHAWDGKWYLRAFYDDGAPLGSSHSKEASIDAISQSWAVLSGVAKPERAEQAMASLADQLIRVNDGLILLLNPPFDKTSQDPGYIKGYVPGVRENGGQYTHAALWTIWAFATLGQGDRAEALFKLLNPIYHSHSPETAEHYKVEPYVVAADVYSVPPHVGRGGWTWYTGAAAWMYRLALEGILGLKRQGDTLELNPSIPCSWQAFTIHYRVGEGSYHLHIDNHAGVNQGVKEVRLDGVILPTKLIPLSQDKQSHEVQILMGAIEGSHDATV
jgi:cyclic beta-1,2-glucan synthetase